MLLICIRHSLLVSDLVTHLIYKIIIQYCHPREAWTVVPFDRSDNQSRGPRPQNCTVSMSVMGSKPRFKSVLFTTPCQDKTHSAHLRGDTRWLILEFILWMVVAWEHRFGLFRLPQVPCANMVAICEVFIVPEQKHILNPGTLVGASGRWVTVEQRILCHSLGCYLVLFLARELEGDNDMPS